MKIIFLDIDGVLNSGKYFKAFPAGLPAAVYMLDMEAIKLLNTIVERTGAKIVISSSWRIPYTLTAIKQMLMERGLKAEVIDVTPENGQSVRGIYINSPARGYEIQAWLNAHSGVEKFVIIDDSTDMVHLLPHLVNTTFAIGLTSHHVEEAVNHLLRS